MFLTRTSRALLVCALALAGPGRAFAQSTTAPRPAVTDDAKARALKHFEHARELYRDGNYRDALVELESAQRLDPDAKDLVYNLAIVSEKLGQFDEALKWMRQYTDMDLDASERGRAELAIRRLEGAKRSLVEQPKTRETKDPTPAPDTTPPNGRIDAWTIGTGSLAVLGLGVGAIFAIDALGSKPKAGFVTGQNGSYAELADQAESAHTKAVIADVGFAVGIASGVACGLLYFLRPKADPPPKAAALQGAVAPTAGGAAFVVKGAM